jgi:hypothetical protein
MLNKRFDFIFTIALLGGIFTATETATANIRKTDDWINGAVAGCATGLTVGIRGIFSLKDYFIFFFILFYYSIR